jgi:2,4-dienoyl-CoA reductase-like NADH-dependent reductase (Old Yellow Enzyme family)
MSKGGKFEDAAQPKVGHAAYPYTGRAATSACRRWLSTPVITAGGIGTFEEAEAVIAGEEADVVGAARQAIADPDWLEKVRRGEGHAVRRCYFTNYCEALDQHHKEVTCQQWDRHALEAVPVALRSKDGKRRLVAP